jgi:hypothetical protein
MITNCKKVFRWDMVLGYIPAFNYYAMMDCRAFYLCTEFFLNDFLAVRGNNST